MLKALFRLLLLIMVPTMIFMSVDAISPLSWIQHLLIQNHHTEDYRGTFYLIDQRLLAREEAARGEFIKQISAEFGHEVKLVSLVDASAEFQHVEAIETGELVFVGLDDVDYLLRRVGISDQVLVMSLSETDYEGIARSADGTVFMLDSLLSPLTPTQRISEVEKLQAEFGIPLRLVSLSEIDMPEKKQLRGEGLDFTWAEHDDGSYTFYYLIPDSDQVLIIGPTQATAKTLLLLIFIIIIFFTVVLTVSLLAWLWPLWRDLKVLGRGASAFGQGKLDQRITLRKSSVASRLGHSFNKMADNIQQLIASHQQLTNAVAHDLRTPLARLRFAVEMLDEEASTEEEQALYKKSITSSVDALDYLINQLLMHSRYSRTVDEKNFGQCKLVMQLQEEVELLQLDAEPLHFEFNCQQDLMDKTLWIDSRAIMRAFNNLLSNASRFARSLVKVTFSYKDGRYCLSVEDDGVGIPEKEWQQVLQPFVQLNNEERESGLGHGLGLAIVNQIAHWHDGEVTITHSSLGGARIVITWPEKTNS
jgi:two-component system sensor histidine kinase RstB